MPQIIRLSLEQKLQFILTARKGLAPMAQVCRAWHVSRQTGYNWLRRYQTGGVVALQEQSRAPRRRPHALPQLWVQRIENLRRRRPSWGPKKLRAALRRQHPRSLRMDNGSPFSSSGAAGLSRLSAWFISLGIEVQFTRRGHPEDNGSHEQWHRVLRAETTRPPAGNASLQAARTTRWLRQYNHERPHEALNQEPPAGHYFQSRRPYRGSHPPRYPKHLPTRSVHHSGEIKWQNRFRFVGEAFAGRYVALKRQRRGVWRVYYYHVLLGELHDADASGLRVASHRHPVDGPRKM
jgi:transposase-like protein